MIIHSERDVDALSQVVVASSKARPSDESAVLLCIGCILQTLGGDKYRCQDVLKTPGYAAPDCGTLLSRKNPEGCRTSTEPALLPHGVGRRVPEGW